MRKIIFIFIFLLGININVFSKVIKLGSLVPTGSDWDMSLKKISAEWSKLSGGKIKLKIYPGGIAGDEVDMIRKIRFGQLDAAAITAIGLNRIFNGIVAIQLPLLIRNDKELKYVLNKMQPYFDKNIEKKGFKVLLWINVGWAHFFSRKPIVSPEDLKKQKIFVWEGNPNLVQTWKNLGFNPVPLAATEVMTSLQSGMVDVVTTSPLTAASYQWFGVVPNMCAMKWAPFIGGIVISKRVWNSIPANIRPKLKKTIEKIGKEMQKKSLIADKKAIKIMKKYKLKIHNVPPEIEKKWKILVDNGLKKLIGKSIPKSAYEKVKKYINEYKNKK